jgi:hypothetical protein
MGRKLRRKLKKVAQEKLGSVEERKREEKENFHRKIPEG